MKEKNKEITKIKETVEEKEEFAKKIEWVIIAKFILYGFALIIAVIRMLTGICLLTPILVYTTLLILVLNLICLFLAKKRLYLYAIAYFSLVIDLLFVTLAVHLQGGLAAPLFPLNYLLIILVASILISSRAGIIITTLSSIAVILLITLEYLNIFPPIPTKGIGLVMYQDKDYVITIVIARVIFFYAVAIMSGYLSDRIKMQTREIREKEKQLIHAERMAMAARIAGESAHEIKNPLAVIKSGLYYLGRILPESEEAQKTISQMDEATERAVAYINNLLNFSRPPMLTIEPVDVHKIIEDSLNELPQEMLAGIEIVKNFALDLPLLPADPDRLKQVFVNLIKNGTEAMGEKVESRKLKVESGKDGEFVKISISDTGKGISEEDLNHIFDPFFTTKGKGTGLGLAIVQRIIEAHKGEIEVKGEIGKGTIFVVKLPVVTL
ncbi:MAG: ATP-binding protein [Nitrospirota bacterium]